VYLNSKDEKEHISLVPGEYSIEIISTLHMGEGRKLMNKLFLKELWQ
jgi:hypothetical protein